MNFKNKKITVMGLGLHGGSEGLIRYLVNQGAKVRVTDHKSSEELEPTIKKLSDLDIDYRFGKHEWRDFSDADMIFINQAVKPGSLWRRRIARSKIPTSTEMNLFFENCPASIIGITGTNGKSTTATLIYEILRGGLEPKKKIFFGGNIGGSLLNKLSEMTENDLIVLELSSFQLVDLEKLKKSPHVAIILNITPDHLDYHKDFAEYLETKKNILKFQDESDFAILNHHQKRTRFLANEARARIFFFNAYKKLKNGVYLKDDFIISRWRGKVQKIMPVADISLVGRHNLENVLAAVACAITYKISPEIISDTVANFQGLSHRMEFVKEINGIKYYNDSKSTTPESTIAALASFDKPIILLAGGSEKYAKFKRMSQEIVKRCQAVYLFGQTAKRIYGSIRKRLNRMKIGRLKLENVLMVDDMKTAIDNAKKISQKGDIVLLSPACASFDQFANFEERGEMFKKIVSRKQ
jgi:UDP-N-acetylmuramoylalanine--D-glutamate ligase